MARKRFYARVEPSFALHDARIAQLTEAERWAYIALWCLSVELRTEIFSPAASKLGYLSHALRSHPNTVRGLVRKASAMRPPLVRVVSGHSSPLSRDDAEGYLIVCGTTKLHSFIEKQSVPYQEQDQEQEQEQEQEQNGNSSGGVLILGQFKMQFGREARPGEEVALLNLLREFPLPENKARWIEAYEATGQSSDPSVKYLRGCLRKHGSEKGVVRTEDWAK